MEMPARVTVLGETHIALDAFITQLDKSKLLVRSPRTMELRALLKIEAKDCLWMGEVVGCRADGQAWVADVCIEHVLRGLTDLRDMADRFLGQTRRDRESLEQVRT